MPTNPLIGGHVSTARQKSHQGAIHSNACGKILEIPRAFAKTVNIELIWANRNKNLIHACGTGRLGMVTIRMMTRRVTTRARRPKTSSCSMYGEEDDNKDGDNEESDSKEPDNKGNNMTNMWFSLTWGTVAACQLMSQIKRHGMRVSNTVYMARPRWLCRW